MRPDSTKVYQSKWYGTVTPFRVEYDTANCMVKNMQDTKTITVTGEPDCQHELTLHCDKNRTLKVKLKSNGIA